MQDRVFIIEWMKMSTARGLQLLKIPKGFPTGKQGRKQTRQVWWYKPQEIKTISIGPIRF